MSVDIPYREELPLIPGSLHAIRAWDYLREGGSERVLLGSVAQGSVWPADRPMEAECLADEHVGDDPPSPECPCGIYARHAYSSSYDALVDCPSLGEVMGVVELEGRIEVHEFGMRAERAGVVALFVAADAPERYRQIVARAARTYGAELVVIEGDADFALHLRESVRGLDPDAVDELLLGRVALEFTLTSVELRTKRYGEVSGFGYLLEANDARYPSLWATSVPTGGYGAEFVRVAGAQHHHDALQEDAFEPGMLVDPVPEPSNPHDPNAIAVWDRERIHKVGYIPRELTGEIGTQLARGKIREAFVGWEWQAGPEMNRIGLHVVIARTNKVLLDGMDIGLARLAIHLTGDPDDAADDGIRASFEASVEEAIRRVKRLDLE